MLTLVLLILFNGVDSSAILQNSQHDEINAFSDKKGLKMFHQNVRGLFSNFVHIQNLFHECKNIDILSLSETHVTRYNNINDLYKIDDFEFVHRNRKNGKGGGVGIYLRNSLKWNRRQDLENEHVENIWIEINIPKSSSILLGVYYRPPNTSKFLSKDFDN